MKIETSSMVNNSGHSINIFGLDLPESHGEIIPLATVRGEEFLYSLSGANDLFVLFRYRIDKEIPGPEEIFKADATTHKYSWTEKSLSPYVALPLLAAGLHGALFYTALYHMDSARSSNPALNENTGLTLRSATAIKDGFLNLFTNEWDRNNQSKLYLSNTHKDILVLHYLTTSALGKKCYIPKHGNIHNLASFILTTGRPWEKMEAVREEKRGKNISIRASNERV